MGKREKAIYRSLKWHFSSTTFPSLPTKLYTLRPSRLNNTVKAETEKLIFNRLQKVGSQSLMALITQLSRVNNFTAYVNKENATTQLVYPIGMEEAMAEEITDVEGAMSYVEHINWIDFAKFDLPKPIYINLVRHPIEKVISAYYYIRHPAVFSYYLLRGGRKLEPKEYFDTSFNDCVKAGKLPECRFDAGTEVYKDWRQFAMYFCGNQPVCK